MRVGWYTKIMTKPSSNSSFLNSIIDCVSSFYECLSYGCSLFYCMNASLTWREECIPLPQAIATLNLLTTIRSLGLAAVSREFKITSLFFAPGLYKNLIFSTFLMFLDSYQSVNNVVRLFYFSFVSVVGCVLIPVWTHYIYRICVMDHPRTAIKVILAQVLYIFLSVYYLKNTFRVLPYDKSNIFRRHTNVLRVCMVITPFSDARDKIVDSFLLIVFISILEIHHCVILNRIIWYVVVSIITHIHTSFMILLVEIILFFVPLTAAHFCGNNKIPFGLEVSKNGMPGLLCSKPACFDKRYADCDERAVRAACTSKNSWIGGFDKSYGRYQPLYVQCCEFENLDRLSDMMYSAVVIKPGEYFEGEEITNEQTDALIAFDFISNLTMLYNGPPKNRTLSFQIDVRRFYCNRLPPRFVKKIPSWP